jgi:hypothetical protein
MMIGYDIYDCFTMKHFRLRQRMTLATKIYCSRLYYCWPKKNSYTDDRTTDPKIKNLSCVNIAFLIKVMYA